MTSLLRDLEILGLRHFKAESIHDEAADIYLMLWLCTDASPENFNREERDRMVITFFSLLKKNILYHLEGALLDRNSFFYSIQRN